MTQPDLFSYDVEWPIRTKFYLYDEMDMEEELREHLKYTGDLPDWWIDTDGKIDSLMNICCATIEIDVNEDGTFKVLDVRLGDD